MARIYALLNKDTLRFIRETKRVSFDYIYRITKFDSNKITSWEIESNDLFPTIKQAKALAKCYRVPFAGFYMNKEDINISHLPPIYNKRTIQDPDADESSVTLALFDLINVRDFYLESKEFFEEDIPSFSLSIRGDDVEEWASIIRRYFALDMQAQYSSSSTRKMYLYLREKIENKGIIIHGFSGVETSVLRGVAISDGRIPVIGINDNDRYPAKTFSIIHELVHIIKRTSSLCNTYNNEDTNDAEEVFCNAVAGELLVPKSELLLQEKKLFKGKYDYEYVKELAKKFSVSSEVIARRLYDTSIECNKAWYLEMSETIYEAFIKDKEELRRKTKEKGIKIPRNMPREAIDRVGTNISEVLIKGYSEGIFDKRDISAHIGINGKHVDKYISEVTEWFL